MPTPAFDRAFRKARQVLYGVRTHSRSPATPSEQPWMEISDADRGRHHHLAVCAIFKDEAPYLREWVLFHHLVGVEKFFLYDNNSSDDGGEVLAPFVESGLVTVHRFPPRKSQMLCYQSCVETYRDHARWIAFIDLDEFLYPVTGDSLVEVLQDYEAHPAVAVNWVVFSTSGHILRPEGLVIEAYTAAQVEGNRHVKLVVDPRAVQSFTTPHTAAFAGGAMAVNELFQPVVGPHSTPPSLSRLRINHYWTKSVEDFLVCRAARGPADNSAGENRDAHALLRAERQYSTGHDLSVQRFLPRLKDALHARHQG